MLGTPASLASVSAPVAASPFTQGRRLRHGGGRTVSLAATRLLREGAGVGQSLLEAVGTYGSEPRRFAPLRLRRRRRLGSRAIWPLPR